MRIRASFIKMCIHTLAADSGICVGLTRRICLIRLGSAALMPQSGAARLDARLNEACSSVILTILLVLSSLSAAEGLAPGLHARLKCSGDQKRTFDVFIPAAYSAEKTKPFPVLLTSSPVGNPGTLGMEGWAEKNGVLIVGINDTRNGMTSKETREIQDDVIKSAETILRMHACLRFSIGISGGAMVSMDLASRNPDKHAGVLLMAHSGNKIICAKHIAVAFVHGDQDKIHPLTAVNEAYDGFKARGNPVRKLVVPGRGHVYAEKSEAEAMLTWMLNTERISHPKLSVKEFNENLGEFKRRIAESAKIADVRARVAECDTLLDLPNVERWQECKALVATWFTARMELANTKTDDAEKKKLLAELSADARVGKFLPQELAKLKETLQKK